MLQITRSFKLNLATSQRATKVIIFVAFFLSGLVGLAYETIWMRMLTFVFGSTTLAVSTALAAFMAGLALGSYALGKLADRINNHLKAYVILEVLVGLYGLSTLVTLTNLDKIYLPLLASLPNDFYLLTAARFVLAFIVIGVGAFLMGGTLPIISRILIKEKDSIGEQFGSIYAINTLGAVFGVLLAGYFLIPMLGLRSGIGMAALLNFLIAAGCWAFLARHKKNTATSLSSKADLLELKTGSTIAQPRIQVLLLIAFALSGFASLACQVLWTKSLALIIGSSVYAFTIMLATFLFGIAVGSMIMVSLFNKIKQRQYFWFGLIQISLAFAVLLGALLIGNLPLLFLALIKWLPHTFLGIQLVEFFVASFAMLPATLLMGAAFPLVCRIYMGSAISDLGAKIGLIYAINTVGAVLGAVAAGFILIPFVGTQTTFKLLAGLYLLIGIVFLLIGIHNRKKWGWFAGGGAVAAGVLLATLSPPWNPVLMYSNFPYLLKTLTERPQVADKILSSKAIYTDEGISGSVLVYQMMDGSLNLNLSGHSEGGNHPGDMPVQIEQAVLPALIHKNPKKALLVGLGAGITLGALLQVEGIEEVDLLEISSGAVKANHFFAEYNNHALQDKRVNVIIDDGRHFLTHTQNKYDLIIITPSYSWVSGTANIFTQEFYRLVRQRLAPDGLFASWFQLYSITPLDIKRFVKTVNSVFPDTSLWLSSSNIELIVLGSEKPLVVDYAAMQQKLNERKLAFEMARISRPIPDSLIALHLMSGKEVSDYVADADLNTDNHPVMEFSIPHHLFTWNVNENIRSFVGDKYAAFLPVGGIAFMQGQDWVIPSLGLKSRLPDWNLSASFVNVYEHNMQALDRRTDVKLIYQNKSYTFDFYASQPGVVNAAQLKAMLEPLAEGGRIESGSFGGRPAYWTHRSAAHRTETFVSWACQGSNTAFLGRLSAPDSNQGSLAAWSSLAQGLQCYNPKLAR